MMYRYYLYHPDLTIKQKLKSDPVGWDTLGKKIKREPKWHGVFFEYTPKLKFVKDGRAFVQFFYEKYGPEAEITLVIEKKNRNTREWFLEYTGRLNLVSLNITPLYAECNVEQSGFIQKMKNRADVKVNLQSLVSQDGKVIPPFTNETEVVSLHSKKIVKEFSGDSETEEIEAAYIDLATMYSLQGSQVAGKKYHCDIVTDDVPTLHVFTYLGTTNGDITDYTYYPSSMSSGTFIATNPAPTSLKYVIPTFEPSRQEIDEFIRYSNQISEQDPVVTSKYYFKVKDAGSYAIDLNIQCRLLTPFWFFMGEDFPLTWKLVYGKPGAYTTVVVGTADSIDEELTMSASYTGTINLQAGDEIYTFGEFTYFYTIEGPGDYPDPSVIFYPYLSAAVCTLDIVADTTFAPTDANLVMMHEGWARVLQSVTDTKDPFRSTLYGRTDSSPVTYGADGAGALRGFCNGSLVRGFNLSDKPIYASINSLLAVCMGIDGAGLGIVKDGVKERIVVEKLSYFYNNARSIQIPFVRDLEKSVLPDLYFNELEGGYDKWANETINNLDEMNARREFTLPISQIKNKLNLVVPWIASGYTWEFVRRDHITISNTKDNDRDNENFILQLRRDGGSFATAIDEDFAELNNVISPETIYNADLSPMRNLRRNGSLVRGALYHKEDKAVKLAFGEGNTAFTSRRNDETEVVDEKTVATTDLTKALWIPELYKFKAPVNREQMEMIEDNLYNYIEFAVDDKSWKKGFVYEIEPDPDSELTAFKLLRANL